MLERCVFSTVMRAHHVADKGSEDIDEVRGGGDHGDGAAAHQHTWYAREQDDGGWL